MHKSATKCNETIGKWCKNKHGSSKIIDMLETYHGLLPMLDYIVEGVGETALLAKGRSGAAAWRSTGSLRLSPFSGCVGGMPLLG
jgi:hypothetical protein